ncbi:hypothetical protein MADP12_00574 [Mycoplasma anatis]|nr:hypothetical protein [Mycoplasmopsis anatis]MBW0599935.1 hypothetical protein [Mycoplasmopsis anatis]
MSNTILHSSTILSLIYIRDKLINNDFFKEVLWMQ